MIFMRGTNCTIGSNIMSFSSFMVGAVSSIDGTEFVGNKIKNS